jgi:hypothetical protein
MFPIQRSVAPQNVLTKFCNDSSQPFSSGKDDFARRVVRVQQLTTKLNEQRTNKGLAYTD